MYICKFLNINFAGF